MKTLITFTLLFTLNLPLNAQWQWQNPLPTGDDLWGIHFINADKGWMEGYGGTMLHTSNGGTSWDSKIVGFVLLDVTFTDPINGWAVGI